MPRLLWRPARKCRSVDYNPPRRRCQRGGGVVSLLVWLVGPASRRLLRAEPLYVTARRRARERGRGFRCAKLFWWFNQGAAVDLSVTPKPYYAADGNKAFGITGTPPGLTERQERSFGKFPFPSFWGPAAGLPCTDWIARCGGGGLRSARPGPTPGYLPPLGYGPPRFGPPGR